MSYTKRQFITKAFGKIGLASYVYDLSPEQLESVMEDLDGMMALWNAKGIRLGYPLPGDPSAGDMDDVTNVPDSANLAIYCNLAILISPNFGKMVPLELKQLAKLGYDTLAARAAMPKEIQKKVMPSGAGNKSSLDRPFTERASVPLAAGPDSDLDFN